MPHNHTTDESETTLAKSLPKSPPEYFVYDEKVLTESSSYKQLKKLISNEEISVNVNQIHIIDMNDDEKSVAREIMDILEESKLNETTESIIEHYVSNNVKTVEPSLLMADISSEADAITLADQYELGDYDEDLLNISTDKGYDELLKDLPRSVPGTPVRLSQEFHNTQPTELRLVEDEG
jgi:hypothetical protein